MSLEARIEELTKAVETLTETMAAGNSGAGAAAGSGTGKAAAGSGTGKTRAAAGKTRAAAGKSKPTRTKSEMTAAVQEVKEAFGTARAKELISDAGFAKLADITEDKYEDVYNAAKELIEDAEEGEEAGDL